MRPTDEPDGKVCNLCLRYLDKAFAFWLSQVIHNRHLEEFVKSPTALDSFVHKLDNQGAAELLLAIADRLRQSEVTSSNG